MNSSPKSVNIDNHLGYMKDLALIREIAQKATTAE